MGGTRNYDRSSYESLFQSEVLPLFPYWPSCTWREIYCKKMQLESITNMQKKKAELTHGVFCTRAHRWCQHRFSEHPYVLISYPISSMIFKTLYWALPDIGLNPISGFTLYRDKYPDIGTCQESRCGPLAMGLPHPTLLWFLPVTQWRRRRAPSH